MVARVFWEDLVRVRLSAPRQAIWAYSPDFASMKWSCKIEDARFSYPALQEENRHKVVLRVIRPDLS